MEVENLDRYGNPTLEWSRVLGQLERTDYRATQWLATTRPDGRAHVAGVGAMWDGGKFYFTSWAGTQKSKNLEKSPSCTIAVSMPNIDLVLDGSATKVSDTATLERLASRYVAQGWPVEARDGALTAPYSAPTAGPGPWDLYEFTPVKAIAVATEEPHGATRWRF